MDIETLSNEWIAAETVEKDNSGYNHWSIDYVIDLSLDDRYEELWNFIKCTYPKDYPNKVTEILAAGPIEDFLAGAGESYFEEISTLARKDKKFKNLLGGVWQNGMSNELWAKICKLRGSAW